MIGTVAVIHGVSVQILHHTPAGFWWQVDPSVWAGAGSE